MLGFVLVVYWYSDNAGVGVLYCFHGALVLLRILHRLGIELAKYCFHLGVWYWQCPCTTWHDPRQGPIKGNLGPGDRNVESASPLVGAGYERNLLWRCIASRALPLEEAAGGAAGGASSGEPRSKRKRARTQERAGDAQEEDSSGGRGASAREAACV